MTTIPLKELRTKKGWTQATLSSKLNVSPSTIGMWEQGRREPAYDFLTRIADIFGVSTDYLLGRRDKNYTMSLSDEQMDLLNDYDSLGEDGQSLLKGLMTSLLMSHAKKPSNIIQKNSGGNKFLNVGGGTNYITNI